MVTKVFRATPYLHILCYTMLNHFYSRSSSSLGDGYPIDNDQDHAMINCPFIPTLAMAHAGLRMLLHLIIITFGSKGTDSELWLRPGLHCGLKFGIWHYSQGLAGPEWWERNCMVVVGHAEALRSFSLLLPKFRPVARFIERGVHVKKYACQWTCKIHAFIKYFHHTTTRLVGGQWP